MKSLNLIDVEVNLDNHDNEILAWVAGSFTPEDVFSVKQLEGWASEHGWGEV